MAFVEGNIIITGVILDITTIYIHIYTILKSPKDVKISKMSYSNHCNQFLTPNIY